jgi:hypothetical protein
MGNVMRHLFSEIKIAAPPAAVWAILTEFAAYPDWNPFVREIAADGDLSEGARLRVQIGPPGRRPMRLKPVVRHLDPGHELRWLGRLGPRGVFDGEHTFRLEATADGGTHFVQEERFTGMLVPLVWRSLREPTRLGFEAMNDALARRVRARLGANGT